jgi:hypothetical protein
MLHQFIAVKSSNKRVFGHVDPSDLRFPISKAYISSAVIFYAVNVLPTLFGEWQVMREWGRIGQGGTLANDHLVTKEYLDFKLKELRYSLILSLGTLITAIIGFFKIMEHFAH